MIWIVVVVLVLLSQRAYVSEYINVYTFFDKSVKTINSNNSTKFEVNWRRGSPKSIQTVKLSIPITVRSLKSIGQGVLNLQRDIRKSNSCLWCSCWWNLDFSFKSYGKEKSLQILYECWRWAYHALLAQLFDIRKIAYNLMNKVP
jgi:hypothetical protein